MNLGRLRVASKGVVRAASGGNGTGLTPVSDDEQFRRGMYMIGQVAALRSEVTTVAELHADVCGQSLLSDLALSTQHTALSEPEAPPPCDVAIIGLSCFYPKAGGLWQYLGEHPLEGQRGHRNPADTLGLAAVLRPRPAGARQDGVEVGRIHGRRGVRPARSTASRRRASRTSSRFNSCYSKRSIRRSATPATSSVRSTGNGRARFWASAAAGCRCPSLTGSGPACRWSIRSPASRSSRQQIIDLGQGILPEWTEDSFPGILLNVAAGRVANRFNLGGPNMAIDAACGSSLAALYAGVRELNDGTSDVAIVMGGDAVQTPYAYVAFSKTHALSPKGRCRPFDAGADGIVLAEGIGVAVLKRLADAERDGDRIYAVIKGIGASSDGRDKGLTAPRAEGQLRALHRAYAQARISPARVGLVEAHGTGTVVGDQTEAQAIGQSVPRRRRCGAVVRHRLGQVDDRAQQVRGRSRRAHQDRVRSAPQGASADARRGSEPEGEPRRRAAVPEHRTPAVGPRSGASPHRGRERVRLRRHKLPHGAGRVHRRLPEQAERRVPPLARGAVRLATTRHSCATCECEAMSRRARGRRFARTRRSRGVGLAIELPRRSSTDSRHRRDFAY